MACTRNIDIVSGHAIICIIMLTPVRIPHSPIETFPGRHTMGIQRSFGVATEHSGEIGVWVCAHLVPSTGEWPPVPDYDAIKGRPTLEITLEPTPDNSIQQQFAQQVENLIGTNNFVIDWVPKSTYDERPGVSYPAALTTFTDERGWDKERLFGFLNAAQLVLQNSKIY